MTNTMSFTSSIVQSVGKIMHKIHNFTLLTMCTGVHYIGPTYVRTYVCMYILSVNDQLSSCINDHQDSTHVHR